MLRGCRTSKHNQIIQECHIVGSSNGIQVCEKPSFEHQDKRQKIVDNVCSNSINTVQTSATVVTFDNSNQISKGQANFQKKQTRQYCGICGYGRQELKCIYCGALFWLKESLKQKSQN